MKKRIHTNLLAWFQKHKRALPWRSTTEPYRRWLSEIMLQQTRVESVLPYYDRFTKRFPTIEELASAPLDEVTQMWAGLGYYSRARNLHKGAQQIVHEHNSQFPQSIEELQKITGIGPYTAAALASLCYDMPVAAIDGNLERVLSRLLALDKVAKGSTEIKTLANELCTLGAPGAINEALMDFANKVCKAKKPLCKECPLQEDCQAYLQNKTDQYPIKAPKKAKQVLESEAFGVFYSSPTGLQFLVAKRPKKVWLAEMWDIPWWISDRDSKLVSFPHQYIGTFRDKRTITHHKIFTNVQLMETKIKLSAKECIKQFRAAGTEYEWWPIEKLSQLPNPSQKLLRPALDVL